MGRNARIEPSELSTRYVPFEPPTGAPNTAAAITPFPLIDGDPSIEPPSPVSHPMPPVAGSNSRTDPGNATH